MDKKDAVIAASAGIIVVLAVKLHDRTRKLARLQVAAHRLQRWTEIAQNVFQETWDKHPELTDELSENTRVNIDFYNIMSEERFI